MFPGRVDVGFTRVVVAALTAFLRPDGRFRCTGLLAGEYRIKEPRDVPAHVFAAGQTNLELRVRRLLTIAGYVVDEHGQPALSDGKKRVKISAKFQRGHVGYIPLEDDGSFRFERVPEPNWRPRARSGRRPIQGPKRSASFERSSRSYARKCGG